MNLLDSSPAKDNNLDIIALSLGAKLLKKELQPPDLLMVF